MAADTVKTGECGSCGKLYPINSYTGELCPDCYMVGQYALLQNADKDKSKLHHIKNILVMARLKAEDAEYSNKVTIKELDQWKNEVIPAETDISHDDVATVTGLLNTITGLNKRHPTIELSIFLRSNVTGEDYLHRTFEDEEPPSDPKRKANT